MESRMLAPAARLQETATHRGRAFSNRLPRFYRRKSSRALHTVLIERAEIEGADFETRATLSYIETKLRDSHEIAVHVANDLLRREHDTRALGIRTFGFELRGHASLDG